MDLKPCQRQKYYYIKSKKFIFILYNNLENVMASKELREMIREMIIDAMSEKVTVKTPPQSTKHTFGADIKDRFYNLSDAGHGLESLGKETKDAVIKLYAKKILALKDSLKKHFNEKYPKWN